MAIPLNFDATMCSTGLTSKGITTNDILKTIRELDKYSGAGPMSISTASPRDLMDFFKYNIPSLEVREVNAANNLTGATISRNVHLPVGIHLVKEGRTVIYVLYNNDTYYDTAKFVARVFDAKMVILQEIKNVDS